MTKHTNRCCFLLVLLSISAAMTVRAVECSYVAKPSSLDKRPLLSSQGECGEAVGEDGFRIYPAHLKKISFNRGLAEVYVGNRVFYLSRSGKTARVYLFDNGADYFSEGLARTVSGNKIGFIDRKLNVRVKPQFDFALPFKKGVAVVCNGCRETAEGEHLSFSGGKWGAIDRENLGSGKFRVRSQPGTNRELKCLLCILHEIPLQGEPISARNLLVPGLQLCNRNLLVPGLQLCN